MNINIYVNPIKTLNVIEIQYYQIMNCQNNNCIQILMNSPNQHNDNYIDQLNSPVLYQKFVLMYVVYSTRITFKP